MWKRAVAGLLVCGCGGRDGTSADVARSISQPLSTAAPGYISAFAGSGARAWAYPQTAALGTDLDSPSGLAICPDGALYVSDTGNNQIVKFSGGVMTVVAGARLTSGFYAGLPYRNLIVNPRAESPVETAGEIAGWTVVSPASGWSEVPWVATRPEPLDGTQYFRANSGASGEMYQEVNINPYLPAIAAGTQQFKFSGFVHSLSGDTTPDAAQVIIEYRNSAGIVLSSYDSGPRANRGEWMLLTDTRRAPTTTRKIRVRLISTRHSGTGNDAYYDGLELIQSPGQFVKDYALSDLIAQDSKEVGVS